MVASKISFSNIQIELLKLYAHQVEEQDLIQIKNLIGQYFSNRLTNIADKAWERNGWTNDDMDVILNQIDQ